MRLLLIAATVLASVAAVAHAEVVIVPFDDANPTPTLSSYSSEVTISVSGTGQAAGTEFSDAFYDFANGDGSLKMPPEDRGFYDLGVGSGGSTSSIDNYFSSIPAYNPTHVYTFNIDTGLSTPAPLDFNVVDDDYADNTGAFTVSVTEAIPEPATWAMMLLGAGLAGAGLRRRRQVVTSA